MARMTRSKRSGACRGARRAGLTPAFAVCLLSCALRAGALIVE
jgi:hypothetical protein